MLAAGQPTGLAVEIEYGNTRYADLWLYCRVTDRSGTVVHEQRGRICTRGHRYRIKKMTVPATQRGRYLAHFRVGHGPGAAIAELELALE